MDKVVHLFRWELMGYIGQPFFQEYQFYVDMDRRLFQTDFDPQRVLIYLYFRRFLYGPLLKHRFFFDQDDEEEKD